MALAIHFMIYGQQRKLLNLSSREYHNAKEMLSNIPISEETKEKMKKPKSEDHIKKLKESHLGNRHSDRSKLKISKANKGREYSEETKEKMKKPKSAEHKENIRQSRIGKKQSSSTLEKMKKPKSEDHKRNISNSLKNKSQSKDHVSKRVSKIKGLKRKRILCKYCGQEFSVSTHNRWHGNNCKSKIF